MGIQRKLQLENLQLDSFITGTGSEGRRTVIGYESDETLECLALLSEVCETRACESAGCEEEPPVQAPVNAPGPQGGVLRQIAAGAGVASTTAQQVGTYLLNNPLTRGAWTVLNTNFGSNLAVATLFYELTKSSAQTVTQSGKRQCLSDYLNDVKSNWEKQPDLGPVLGPFTPDVEKTFALAAAAAPNLYDATC